MKDVKLSIIIPAYNEANTILEILRVVQEEKHKKEIIIIDDCSSDGTRELLRGIKDSNVKVLFNEKNMGKGYCIRQGIPCVTGDIAIIQDADLEYYPDEYEILIKKIQEDKADVVYGSRFLGSHRAFLYWHYLGNKLINLITNVLLNTILTDMMTCYKAFRAPILKELKLKANGFGIEAEITAEVFKRYCRVYEVPISYNGRSYDEGKKINWTDFFKSLYWLLRSWVRGIDLEEETLLRTRLLRNRNRWIISKFKPFLGKRVLETGSGIGTFSRFLIAKDREVSLAEISPRFIEYLSSQFAANPKVKILQADINKIDEAFPQEYFDTIFCVNVLEHIEDDMAALSKFKKILSKNGRLLLLVPAHKQLFGGFDKLLGHYRRYERKELIERLNLQGFSIEKIEYMNALGAMWWFLNYKLLRRTRMTGVGSIIFDKLVPGMGLFEKIIPPPFGLSLICVARVKETV